MTFYCPSCWKEIRGDAEKCTHCGADLTEHDQKSFDEKLIQALRHPIRETAGMAVWILGELTILFSRERYSGPSVKSEHRKQRTSL
jgi:uncharacterized membrane protein YvbJ